MNEVNLNIGCGDRITPGYLNYDKSFSARLSKLPQIFIKILYLSKIIAQQHYDYINFIKENNIRFCDARKRIPLKDAIVDNVYSSHTLEHLNYSEADKFLKECNRVLKISGGIRIIVPNLRLKIEDYIKKKDADDFFVGLEIAGMSHKSHVKNFGKIKHFLRELINDGIGHRHIYDEESLKKKLIINNFKDPKVIKPGETSLKNLGKLDLYERSDEKSQSLCVEAFK